MLEHESTTKETLFEEASLLENIYKATLKTPHRYSITRN